MTTTNEDTVKAAAQQMCAVFATKGVKVKHSLMLEALAEGFGVDSWRALKAVIDAPRAAPVIMAPPLGTPQSWQVEAVYLDNDQPYCDDFYGRTPLEAAIDAIMERRTDFGNVIGISKVSNEGEGATSLLTWSLREITLLTPRAALEALLKAYNAHPRKAGEAHVCRNWLTAWLKANEKDTLMDLLECEGMRNIEGAGVLVAVNEWVTISEAYELTPSKAVLKICECVEGDFASVMEMEDQQEELAKVVYQVRAMTTHFGDNFDHPNYSVWCDVEFDPLAA